MTISRDVDEYDDMYRTCVETYSTLRIYSDHVDPDRISQFLGLNPTSSFKLGAKFGTHGLRRKVNGWFFSTEGVTDSKDTRHHIDLILNTLDGKTQAVHELQQEKCRFDICSYWLSVGQGGPTLWPRQMMRLGELNIEVWWDMYFSRENET